MIEEYPTIATRHASVFYGNALYLIFNIRLFIDSISLTLQIIAEQTLM